MRKVCACICVFAVLVFEPKLIPRLPFNPLDRSKQVCPLSLLSLAIADDTRNSTNGLAVFNCYYPVKQISCEAARCGDATQPMQTSSTDVFLRKLGLEHPGNDEALRSSAIRRASHLLKIEPKELEGIVSVLT
jgi:hypothetical protein